MNAVFDDEVAAFISEYQHYFRSVDPIVKISVDVVHFDIQKGQWCRTMLLRPNTTWNFYLMPQISSRVEVVCDPYIPDDFPRIPEQTKYGPVELLKYMDKADYVPPDPNDD
jgi:hypothetical protein